MTNLNAIFQAPTTPPAPPAPPARQAAPTFTPPTTLADQVAQVQAPTMQREALERTKKNAAAIARQYGGGEPSLLDSDDDLIEADPSVQAELAGLVTRRHLIDAMVKSLNDEKSVIDKLVKDIIAEHDGLTIGGELVATYKASTRTTVNQQLVKSTFPEGLASSAPFYTTTEVRSIRYEG